MANQPIVRLVSGDELIQIQSAIEQRIGTMWRGFDWITKDKRRIPLSKMDNQHVVNALHYFNEKKDHRTTIFLTLEAAYRGLLEISIFELLRLSELAGIIKGRQIHGNYGGTP